MNLKRKSEDISSRLNPALISNAKQPNDESTSTTTATATATATATTSNADSSKRKEKNKKKKKKKLLQLQQQLQQDQEHTQPQIQRQEQVEAEIEEIGEGSVNNASSLKQLKLEQDQLEKQLIEQQKLQQMQIEQLQKQIDEFVEAETNASAKNKLASAMCPKSMNGNDLSLVLNDLSEALIKTNNLNQAQAHGKGDQVT